ETIGIGLDLCGIERVRLVDEIVLDHVLKLEITGNLADRATGIEKQPPAVEDMKSPVLTLVPAAGKHIGELHLRFGGDRRIHLRGKTGELLHDDLSGGARILSSEFEASRPALEISGIDLALALVLEIGLA